MKSLMRNLLEWEGRRPFLLIGVLMVFCIAVGLPAARAYGLSWDEPISRHNGEVSLAYVLNGDPTLWTYSERYYGALFEMPFAYLQEILEFSSVREIFFFRHAATFLVFLGGVFVFFLICLKRFRSGRLCVLGAAFLLASPRIFADAFYNSKDIPVLVFFIVSVFTLLRFLEKPSYPTALWHASATAVLISIRLPGIFIPVMTIGFLAANMVFLPEERAKWRSAIPLLVAYCISTAALTVLFWPFLWQNPIGHFAEALADMSRFSRQLDMQVLYLGEYVAASELPWHYIPVWIALTTPPLYLALFTGGVGVVARRFMARDFAGAYRAYRQDLVVLAWLLGPLFAVVLLNSVLYDGWRHLYFIYPAIIYIGLAGLNAVSGRLEREGGGVRKARWLALGVLLSLHFLVTVSFMVRNHPYQNLYFNFLAGSREDAARCFEMDYWGLSFREGLEYIAASDGEASIPIAIKWGSPDTVLILPPETLRRFEALPPAEFGRARYILTNYRWQDVHRLPHEREVFSVRVDGAKVMSVFKAR